MTDQFTKTDAEIDKSCDERRLELLAGQIDHPQHYGGADNPYEAIKVIEAWGLGFCLGNTAKYISRAGKKAPHESVADLTKIEDLKKARWYLDREISNLEKANG